MKFINLLKKGKEIMKREKCHNCKAKLAGKSPMLECPSRDALVQNYRCSKGCVYKIFTLSDATKEIEYSFKRSKECHDRVKL